MSTSLLSIILCSGLVLVLVFLAVSFIFMESLLDMFVLCGVESVCIISNTGLSRKCLPRFGFIPPMNSSVASRLDY